MVRFFSNSRIRASRIDHIFCTIWFFTTWVDCERSIADGRTAKVLGILTELSLFPCRCDIKWLVPLTDTCSSFTWTAAGTRVSWYHLNQISNPTVRTIKVTGLGSLYRKDDKYVSKGNVLLNLQHILISIDCHSTCVTAKSSCHPTIGIVRLTPGCQWKRHCEYMSAWVRVITYSEFNHIIYTTRSSIRNQYYMPRSRTQQEQLTSSLVSAPLIPSDTCRRVYFCSSSSAEQSEVHLRWIWRNFRKRWGHWIYM